MVRKRFFVAGCASLRLAHPATKANASRLRRQRNRQLKSYPLLYALCRWKDLQGICEAVEEVEQADYGGEFDKLTIVEMRL